MALEIGVHAGPWRSQDGYGVSTHFPKAQHFGYWGNLPVALDEGRHQKQTARAKSAHHRLTSAVAPSGGFARGALGDSFADSLRTRPRSSLPDYVTFDKKVLCFDAVMEEPEPRISVATSPPDGRSYDSNDSERKRPVKLYFFLEDDTIQIRECRHREGDIPQSKLLRRQRIPLPEDQRKCAGRIEHHEKFYGVEHLSLGQVLHIYGRRVKLVRGDVFTLEFLKSCGLNVGKADPVEFDSLMAPDPNRIELSKMVKKSRRAASASAASRKKLELADHVLRFFVYWIDDQAETPSCRLRTFELRYYLGDDTVELVECPDSRSKQWAHKTASGSRTFLRRGKLPKGVQPHPLPGSMVDHSVLNVIRSRGNRTRSMLDVRNAGQFSMEYYQDCDLQLGQEIDVWGRKMTIYDCDGFTEHYYRLKFGLEEFPKFQPPDLKEHSRVLSHDVSTQVMGFGQPAKPLRLGCERPRKFNVDPQEQPLRFSGYIAKNDAVNRGRRFILSIYPSDSGILIYEIPQENSGIRQGKFLERTKVRHPGRWNQQGGFPYYDVRDFYVGAKLNLNGVEFVLDGADEKTLSRMEADPDTFSCANARAICRKISEKLVSCSQLDFKRQCVAFFDHGSEGACDFKLFRPFLENKLGKILSEHEWITLLRRYSVKQGSGESAAGAEVNLWKAVQEELRLNGFEEFLQLKRKLQHADTFQRGRLDAKLVQNIVRVFKLPLQSSLLRNAILRTSDSDGLVDYHELMKRLDYMDHPVSALPNAVVALAEDLEPRFAYEKLIEDVFGGPGKGF